MTDTFGSIAQPSSLLPDLGVLDPPSIDKNLREIRQAEASWRLPALPDQVRLDLASRQGLLPSSLSMFMHSIDRDFHEDVSPAQAGPGRVVHSGPNAVGIPTLDPQGPVPQDPLSPQLPELYVAPSEGTQFGPLALDSYQSAGKFLNSLRTLPPEKIADPNAVQRWKMRAIEKGYLARPENGVVDSSWSPELSGLQREMSFAELNDVYRGDHAGAMPIMKFMDKVGEWTSPSGLLRQAVNLDLWWSPSQIGKEFSSWGDKWRKVGDAHNPWEFTQNLFDAMTGPIDDIVVPALNLALLATGVGEGVNFARLGMMGAAEGAEALRASSLVYKLPMVGRVFPALDTTAEAVAAVDKIREASWISQRLQKGGTTAEWFGTQMENWRRLPGVVGTKRVVQTGMRLGLVSQAEQRLLPNYQGASFGDMKPVAAAADRALLHPFGDSNPASMVLNQLAEIMVSPYGTFEAGTFTKGGRDAVNSVFKYVGTTAGHAVIGGVAGAAYGAHDRGDAGDVVQGALVGAAAGAAIPLVGEKVGSGAAKFTGTVTGKIAKPFQHMGDFAALALFENISNDQLLTKLFMDAHRANLSVDEKKLAEFEDLMKTHGFKHAFGQSIGIADDATLGSAMTQVLLHAAIDHTTKLQAGKNIYNKWAFTNALRNQLRVIGPETDYEKIAYVLAGSARGQKAHMKRFEEVLDELYGSTPEHVAEMVAHHDRQATLTAQQLMSIDNLPLGDLTPESMINLGMTPNVDPFNPSAAPVGDIKMVSSQEDRLAALTEYIQAALPTFGNHSVYLQGTTAVRQVVRDGLLTDAVLTAPRSVTGRRMSMVDALKSMYAPDVSTEEAWYKAAKKLRGMMFLDPTTDPAKYLKAGGYSNPLARTLDPNGSRFTLMRTSTKSAHQYLEAADELDDVIQLHDSWDAVRTATHTVRDSAGNVVSNEKLIDILGPQMGKLSRRQLGKLLAGYGVTNEKRVKGFQRLNRLAEQKLFMVGVQDTFLEDVQNLATQQGTASHWWEEWGLESNPTSKDGRVLSGIELLRQRSKALKRQANLSAKEIDTMKLVASLRSSHGDDAAQGFMDQVKLWDSQGYKLVYGHDFLMPDEMLHSAQFEDINARHLHSVTLGNFFGRRHPETLSNNMYRARARGIATELSRARGLKTPLQPDDPEVIRAMENLKHHILDPALDNHNAIMDDWNHRGFADRALTSVRESNTPRSYVQLGLGTNKTRVVDKLTKLGWDERDAVAVWQGLKAGRYAEWKDLGLAAVEAKLRGNNQFIDALHVLGGTTEGGIYRASIPAALAGGAFGAVVGASSGDPGDSDWETRLREVGGAVAGAAGIGLARGVAGKAITDRIVQKADFSTGKWARYGYLADEFASLRDKMRFTLSPFFDIERRAKSYMLGVTAAPSHLADGTQIALPANQSPSALRKGLVKGLVGTEDEAGQVISKLRAEQMADSKIQEINARFRAAGGSNHDPDFIEATQKVFTEIGITGHSPTKWMTSSFHHLTEAGMSDADALTEVKNMYTYGTSGRSAAEQSINFIFFPFSFQKKVYTKAASWMSQDMTRAIYLHDAMKAYHILDERYDLDGWAKDHLPVLEKLHQLNMFGFGISPGRFGGINAGLINGLVGDPLSKDPSHRGLILNMFGPNGVAVSNKERVDELADIARKMVPLVNDLQHMVEDSKSQMDVLFDPAHKTRAAQARDGAQEWSEYRKGIAEALKVSGAQWSDLRSNPALAPLAQQFDVKKHEIEVRYPGWVDARLRGLGNILELEQERKFRTQDVAMLGDGAAPVDLAFVNMDQLLEQAKQRLRLSGGDWTEMSPADFDYIRSVGFGYAQQVPGFQMLWDKFYAKDFGPLMSEAR